MWFAQKHLLLQEKLQWHSLAGGSLPPPRSWAVQAHSPRMQTPGCRGWGSALFPWCNNRRCKGESPCQTDNSPQLPAAPGTAGADGRLSTAAFPVAFNGECSCQAERIQAGGRNCPSTILKGRAAVHLRPSEIACLFPGRLQGASRAFRNISISKGAVQVAGTRAGLQLCSSTHQHKAAPDACQPTRSSTARLSPSLLGRGHREQWRLRSSHCPSS